MSDERTAVLDLVDPVMFGQRLRHFRKLQEMTLDDLGAVIGRPAPFLSLVENGKREPKLSQIGALAAAVGVTPAELLDPTPPNRRADLEIRLERAQDHPRYEQLGLPHLKPSARVPDDVLEHLLTLFDELSGANTGGDDLSRDLRRANGILTRQLAETDGYMAEVEGLAKEALTASGYGGSGPITTRTIRDLATHFGYRLHNVDGIPPSVRSITDTAERKIYVAQRNELRTRQVRKAILQTLATEALGHAPARSPLELLRQRLESSYFAAAVILPEAPASVFLKDARAAKDLAIEDLKEAFYTSYEMAAQRFTNLATRHLGLPCHFIRVDRTGVIWKSYTNDGLPLPTDSEGGSEGQRVCRLYAARVAFDSEGRYAIHHQFTDTPVGSFFDVAHTEAGNGGHTLTVGVRFGDAGVFRGRSTTHHTRSSCPDGSCCIADDGDDREVIMVNERTQDQIVGLLAPRLGGRTDPASVVAFAHRLRTEEVPSLFAEDE